MNITAGMAIAIILAGSAFAQTSEDQAAVQELPQQFNRAFNNHDAQQLAQLMKEDVDFVNVGLTWIQRREDFEKYHARLFASRFGSITQKILGTHVRFIRPDVAVVRFGWTVQGDTNPDGTPRAPRSGLMTLVAEKSGGNWLIAAAQNINSPTTPISAEGQAFKPPIPIPRGQ